MTYTVLQRMPGGGMEAGVGRPVRGNYSIFPSAADPHWRKQQGGGTFKLHMLLRSHSPCWGGGSGLDVERESAYLKRHELLCYAAACLIYAVGEDWLPNDV